MTVQKSKWAAAFLLTSFAALCPADELDTVSMAGSLGLYRAENDFEAVVDLDASAADELRGRRLHAIRN